MAPTAEGSYSPWWKRKSSYIPYLLLVFSYLLIITLFGFVFFYASRISAEMNQLHERSMDLFPCGSKTREWEYYDGQCYYFSVDVATWPTASALCEDKDAHLVVIHNEGEQNFVQSRTRHEKFWIGLNDLASEGEWKWIDGTEYRKSFKKWKKGEPNDFGNIEDCAEMTGWGWYDIPCNREIFYVCQKPLPS